MCVFQSKRDILSETKYIELVLVADHQEVSERTTGASYTRLLLVALLSGGGACRGGRESF